MNKIIKKLGALLLFILLTVCSHTQEQPLSYLALGDFYTIGEKVSPADRWPVQLVESLREKGIAIEAPKIIAQTGWTTDELLTAIEDKDSSKNYDVVSLLIGVNNQYRGYKIDTYKKEFKELLKQAIDFAQGNPEQVFVVSIPDYGATPFGQLKNPRKIAKELNTYNAIARKISRTHGVSFVNITPGSKKAVNNPNLVAGDNLHPSGIVYQQWEENIVAVIWPKLQ